MIVPLLCLMAALLNPESASAPLHRFDLGAYCREITLSSPQVSPDGRRVAVVRSTPDFGDGDLCTIAADETVPISSSYALYHTLKDHHIPVRFIALPGAHHHPGDPVRKKRFYELMVEWITEHDRIESAEATIRVDDTGRTMFRDFGTSVLPMPDYARLTPQQRKTLGSLLWRDLRLQVMRLWFGVARYAPDPVKRVLNDLDHGVSYWIWFLGDEAHDPNDDQTRLIRWWPNPDSRFEVLTQYLYIKHLSLVFLPGSMVLRCVGNPGGDMVWTYGVKPPITAAAAIRPDGKWVLGACNYTSDRFGAPNASEWDRTQGGYTARTTTFTFQLPASCQARPFLLLRTNGSQTMREEGLLALKGGRLLVSVGPLELVTLESAQIVSQDHSERGNKLKKIKFDLNRLDSEGLRGSADGKVAVSYEFCIPDARRYRAQVKRIDPTVQFLPGSSGRIGARKGECLCLGSTHQPHWRLVLSRLAALRYVRRIIETYFE